MQHHQTLRAPVALKSCEGAFLVNTHQATVGGDIGREDGSQPPFDTRLVYENRPAVSRCKTNIDFQIEIVLADGIRLPICGSDDFGASPFLEQLSGKRTRLTASERYIVSVSMTMSAWGVKRQFALQ